MAPKRNNFTWRKIGNKIHFEAQSYCAVFFENPSFFGKTYIRLYPEKPETLDILDGTFTGYFVLDLIPKRSVGDPPPIT